MARRTQSKKGTLDEGKPGAVARNLDDVIDHRRVRNDDGTTSIVEVTVLDRACETLRFGGFIKDVAARCGVAKQTVHEWERRGTRVLADLHAGRLQMRDLSEADKQSARFVQETSKAEVEGKTFLLGLAERLSRGIEREIVTETIDPTTGNVIERKVRREDAIPDAQMIRWRLERRWPEDYGRSRLELTGADGGPINIEQPAAITSLLAQLERIRTSHTETKPAHNPVDT